MKTSTSLLALSALSAVFASPSLQKRANTVSNANTPPVTVKGNAFFANGKRFYIRGVDYQPGGAAAAKDPIADAAGCKRDVAEFKKLGINTIRVYTVDNSANHDDCMKALADAGIYLALDVNSPKYSLNRENIASIERSYNDVYLQFVFATIDVFSKYDNTLLFYSANEVINNDANSFAAPFVKAVTRDMRAYIKARGYRSIPVGYSAADIDSNRFEMASYMNCGPDAERSDFFAFNDYSWCDPSTFEQSGWNTKVNKFKDYSIPLFLSEFGCNTNKRQFNELTALYSDKMTSVYSGGLVYEYSMEESKYGIVQINGDSVQELDDFATLQKQLAANPVPSGDGGYKSSGAASACPATSQSWVVSNSSLPQMPTNAQKYFTSGAGAGPGLKSDAGSQNAGTATPGYTGQSGTPNGTSSGSKTGTASSIQTGSWSIVGVAIVAIGMSML